MPASTDNDRLWVTVNFDRLVRTIRPVDVVDRLVAKRWFSLDGENYQRISAAETAVGGARLLLQTVPTMSPGYATDLRNIVIAMYPDHDWLYPEMSADEPTLVRAAQRTSGFISGREGESATSRHDDSTPVSPVLSTSATNVNRTGAPRPVPRRRRRTDAWYWRIWLRCAPSRPYVGMILVLAISYFVYDFLQPEMLPGDSAKSGQRTSPPATGGNQEDSATEKVQELPREVVQFREGFLTKAIEDQAYDNPLPWLEESAEPVEQLHVRLVITTKIARAEIDRSPLNRETPAILLPDHDPMDGAIPVNVSDIFNRTVDGSPVPISRVILQAEAGMGKTFTFAKMMPLRWLRQNDGLWSDIELVFVIHLGDPDIQDAKNFEDVFFSSFTTVNESMKTVVMEFIKSSPERVLLVCDAFDEGEKYLAKIVLRILRGKDFPGLRVLVTSRPCAGIRELAKHTHRQLELLGVAESDLPEFIQKQLKRLAPGKADILVGELQHQLRDRKDMVNLMGSPLIATLVCRLFAAQQYLPGSTTELYEQIIMNLLRRANEKTIPNLLSLEDDYTDNPRLLKLTGKATHLLKELSKLAMFGVQNGKVVFTIHDVKAHCSEDVLEMGILARLSKRGKALLKQHKVTFFHLTFMEFFASLALTRQCMKIPEVSFQLNIPRTECIANSLREFPLNDRDRNIIIWFFTAGQASLLQKEALYDYDLGQRSKTGYLSSCALIKKAVEFSSHGMGTAPAYNSEEIPWVVALSVLQVISELHVDSKRQGGRYPDVCRTSVIDILQSLQNLVQRHPVLGRLVSTSYWEESKEASIEAALHGFL